MTESDPPEMEDLLDLGLNTAFRPVREPGSATPVTPAAGSAEELPPEEIPERIGRYEVLGVLGRGGLGIVLRVRDPELGREVALKYLQKRLGADPIFEPMFQQEARLMSRAQHPGIVPLHEFGTLADGRHYYTMKLIAGESLHERLRRREGRGETDRLGYVEIFERVCQTMAFAHSRGVTHGDLKPANVMVGAFGEVQVLDWGFAKAASAPLPRPDGEKVRVLGTPAYMSPEQARGSSEQIDARSDVFGLGSILCEILTRYPPYRGATREEIYLRAARAWLDDAYDRLESSGAERELTALARRCLAPDPAHRPANAGEVETEVSRYLASLESKARRLAVEAAAARARAEVADAQAMHERKARIATRGFAVAISCSVVLAAAGVAWYLVHQGSLREEATRRASGALERAVRFRDRAQDATEDRTSLWEQASAVALEAEQVVLDPRTPPDLADRARALVLEVKMGGANARRDDAVLRAIYEMRPHPDDDRTPDEVEAGYLALFAEFGVDPDRSEPQQTAAAVRESQIGLDLAVVLHEWAHYRQHRRAAPRDTEASLRLLRHADAIDTDPWRTELRRVCGAADLARLRQMRTDQDLQSDPGQGRGALAECIAAAGDVDTAIELYRLAHYDRMGDARVSHDLAVLLGTLADPPRNEITKLFTAAAAARPRGAHVLTDISLAVLQEQRTDVALVLAERARLLDPGYRRAWTCLADVKSQTGDFEGAVVAARKVVRLGPERGSGHLLLAQCLARSEVGRREALAVCRQAVALLPEDGPFPGKRAEALRTLGELLVEHGFLREALEAGRSALRIAGEDGLSCYGMGLALQACGMLEEAQQAHRRSLERLPERAETHCNLGLTLGLMGRFGEALDAVRIGHDLGSKQSHWRYPSDVWISELEALRSLLGPLEQCERGEREPGSARERVALAEVALRRGGFRAAARLFREAFALEPSLLPSHVGSAVRSAARAGSAHATETDRTTPEEQARWREQARDWIETAISAARSSLAQDADKVDAVATRRSWETLLVSPDLALVREPESLRSMTDADRARWIAVWDHVRDVLAALQDR